jgi:hypothetical protein
MTQFALLIHVGSLLKLQLSGSWMDLLISLQLNGYKSALTISVIIQIRVKYISISFTNFGPASRIIKKAH